MGTGRFTFVSGDGTRVTGWRGGDESGIPVVISNGLGTPPAAWPTVIAAGSGFRVATWYYRGTAGGDRPADTSRIGVRDHAADLLALMDHEGLDRALLACWSLGVNVGTEVALAHPDRVAGLLMVAGVPGGTFAAMGEPLRVPRPLRHHLGVAGARLGRRIGRPLSWVARHTPLTATTSRVISHSGFVLPAATPDRLMPALAEFREHDFRWYFTLAEAAADHQPLDVSALAMPVSIVAGRHDVLTSAMDMMQVAERIPDATLHVLPGSHFLPLEYPDECAGELRQLALRAGLAT